MDGDDDELLGAASSAPGAIEQWGLGPDDAAALASTTSTSGLRRTLTEARPPARGQPFKVRQSPGPGYGTDARIGREDELVPTASNVDRKTLPREIPWGALIDITNRTCSGFFWRLSTSPGCCTYASQPLCAASLSDAETRAAAQTRSTRLRTAHRGRRGAVGRFQGPAFSSATA